jgi:hypothetical protein
MNFSQKLGLFILILISVSYVYFSFFNNKIEIPQQNKDIIETPIYNPLESSKQEESV